MTSTDAFSNDTGRGLNNDELYHASDLVHSGSLALGQNGRVSSVSCSELIRRRVLITQVIRAILSATELATKKRRCSVVPCHSPGHTKFVLDSIT